MALKRLSPLKFSIPLIFGFSAPGLFAAADEPRKSLTVAAAGPWEPFVKSAVANVAKANKVRIQIHGQGQKQGYECVVAKKCQLAVIASQEVAAADARSLVVRTLGIKATGILVTNDVSISNITNEQVRDAFQGKIKNWKEIGGPDLPLVVWQRPKTRGGRELFESVFDAKTEDFKGVEIATHSELMYRLKTAKGVITYNTVDRDWNDASGNFKYLTLNGVKPTPENLVSGKYKFRGPIRVAIHKDFANDPLVKELYTELLAERKSYFSKMGIVITDSEP